MGRGRVGSCNNLGNIDDDDDPIFSRRDSLLPRLSASSSTINIRQGEYINEQRPLYNVSYRDKNTGHWDSRSFHPLASSIGGNIFSLAAKSSDVIARSPAFLLVHFFFFPLFSFTHMKNGHFERKAKGERRVCETAAINESGTRKRSAVGVAEKRETRPQVVVVVSNK